MFLNCGHQRVSVNPPDDTWVWRTTGENRIARRKPCPSTSLPTINPTWSDQGVNPGPADRSRWLLAWAMTRPSLILIGALHLNEQISDLNKGTFSHFKQIPHSLTDVQASLVVVFIICSLSNAVSFLPFRLRESDKDDRPENVTS